MIEGKKVILRAFELSDSAELYVHFNDSGITQFIQTDWNRPSSSMEIEERIKNFSQDIISRKAYPLGIIEKSSGDLIGMCGLFAVNQLSAEIGLSINKDKQGKGYGTEASKLMLGFAFNDLNLVSVFSMVMANNEKSMALFKKLGFMKSAVLRERKYSHGKYVDMIRFDILRDEFK